MSRIGSRPPVPPVTPVTRVRRPTEAGKDPEDETRPFARRPEAGRTRRPRDDRSDGSIDEMA